MTYEEGADRWHLIRNLLNLDDAFPSARAIKLSNHVVREMRSNTRPYRLVITRGEERDRQSNTRPYRLVFTP